MWVERILLVSGFALLGVYGAARVEGILGARTALSQFACIAASPAPASQEVAGERDPSEVDSGLWEEHRVQAYQTSREQSSAVPLAVLHISKIGLEVPVLEGTDGLTLNHAVGRIAGTARPKEPGNIGIAGHRDGFFRGLKDVGVGDTIELRTREGSEHYSVDEIKIVNPNDVDVLRPRSVASLTLVTCYPFHFIGRAPQRYIVHASHTGFERQNYNRTEQGSLLLANEKQEKTK
ncbi:MAG: class D sortase [Terriglobales bacterium]